MKKIVLALAVIILLLPISQGFAAEYTETEPTLGVKLTSTAPFSYKDEQGYTVVIGEVENTRTFPVQNVKVWVGFYSGKAGGTGGQAPLEANTGNTLLEVIPAKGKSPFIIKSTTPNSEISQVTINILGFNSAPQKQQVLQVTPSTLTVGSTIKMMADVQNTGQQESTKTNVHLIAFDAFKPPRIVGIKTVTIDEITQGKNANAQFDVSMDYRAVSFKVIAESDLYQSKLTDVKDITLEAPTRLISINNVQILDDAGERVSEFKVGTPVNITSDLAIQFSAIDGAQDYVYYAQVKHFGEAAPVEFIGTSEGTFSSAVPQTALVTWTPQQPGGFFIEAYVWDPDGVALAPPSKTISIVLVTE